jgi:lipoprotein
MLILRNLPTAGDAGKSFAAIILSIGMACPCGRTDRHVVMCSESEFIHYSLRPLFACGNAVSIAPEVQLAEVRIKRLRMQRNPHPDKNPQNHQSIHLLMIENL